MALASLTGNLPAPDIATSPSTNANGPSVSRRCGKIHSIDAKIQSPAVGTSRDQAAWTQTRLLSKKCKRRSGALNPWSCGQGGFGRVTADLGNVAPSPRIFGKLATFFFSER